jgi:hypothetical protein
VNAQVTPHTYTHAYAYKKCNINKYRLIARSESESGSYITTDGQSVSLSWNKAPILGLRPELCYCQTFAGLFMWGALSDERTDLSLSLMLRPTVSQPVCLGIKHPSGAYDQIFITFVTVTVLFLWGAFSDERSGLSFLCAAGPCQRSRPRVRVPWDLKPYFTVSDSRLPFSSPPTTRSVTVEVFDPASTRVI